jgi:hypothetical protein
MKKGSVPLIQSPIVRPMEGGLKPCSTELGVAVAQALAPRIARGLGFDLRAAVNAHDVRIVALHTLDGRPLPSDWAIPILLGEVVVVCAPLSAPFSGVAAILVRGAALPRPEVDEATRERVARALARAVLADLKLRPR